MDNKKELQKLKEEMAGMKLIIHMQQAALEKLEFVVKGHQKIHEAASGYRPPDPGKASEN